MLVTAKLHDMTINVLSDSEDEIQRMCDVGGTNAKFQLAGPISAEFF
jgi:hypothetical protein